MTQDPNKEAMELAEAAKILEDYAKPFSMIDNGNLFYAAKVFQKHLTASRLHTLTKDPVVRKLDTALKQIFALTADFEYRFVREEQVTPVDTILQIAEIASGAFTNFTAEAERLKGET